MLSRCSSFSEHKFKSDTNMIYIKLMRIISFIIKGDNNCELWATFLQNWGKASVTWEAI